MKRFAATDSRRRRGAVSGRSVAVLVGLLGGIALVVLSRFDLGLWGPRIDRTGRIAIAINGVGPRKSRDVLLPTHGWTLQVRHPEFDRETVEKGLDVRLRAEHTGATLQIEDRLEPHEGFATIVIPESFGIAEGLLSVRARLTDEDGRVFEDSHRIRIRRWLGGPPIGSRQVIEFDFDVDHDGNGITDFLEDLERFGLASRERPDLSRAIAARIEQRAIERVERAYDTSTDPNQTGFERDPVHVRFRPSTDASALVTRICVGGRNLDHEDSVGYVRFDRRNEDKFSEACGGEPFAGIFPGELDTYRDSPLYREALGPFDASNGGTAMGARELDTIALLDDPSDSRGAAIRNAIEVFGDALGSVMAHEAGHALGLVAPGRPGVGLFGGTEGAAYAHNVDAHGGPESGVWLMNPGRGFSFEQLAGRSEVGELGFRPLNYAYLRDRVVLADPR